METIKDFNSRDSRYTMPLNLDRKHIRRESKTLADEKILFMDNVRLGDISIGIEDGVTQRKVRRIIEKRVCQNYWKARQRGGNSASNRYAMRRRVSNHFKNIYGFVPVGFEYVS